MENEQTSEEKDRLPNDKYKYTKEGNIVTDQQLTNHHKSDYKSKDFLYHLFSLSLTSTKRKNIEDGHYTKIMAVNSTMETLRPQLVMKIFIWIVVTKRILSLLPMSHFLLI